MHGEQAYDIAIVGGGFTGMWTAYFLKKLDPSIRIAILEQKTIGYGASGRNGGMACATIDQSHAAAILRRQRY